MVFQESWGLFGGCILFFAGRPGFGLAVARRGSADSWGGKLCRAFRRCLFRGVAGCLMLPAVWIVHEPFFFPFFFWMIRGPSIWRTGGRPRSRAVNNYLAKSSAEHLAIVRVQSSLLSPQREGGWVFSEEIADNAAPSTLAALAG